MMDKVEGIGIKDYVDSHKFCSFNSTSCNIEAKYGKLTFDSSRFGNVKALRLAFRRISGNGVLTLVNSGTLKNHSIVSKKQEVIEIHLNNNKNVSIIRPASSIGNIELLSVCIIRDATVIPQNPIDLRAELNRCTRKSIRSVKDRFFAGEGSELKAEHITVKTSPPNMFESTDDSIRFKGTCEIVDVSVGKAILEKKPEFIGKVQGYNSLEAVKVDFQAKNIFSYHSKYGNEEIKLIKDSSIILEGMTLGRYGKISIPNIKLDKDSWYTISIKTSKIDGNGKITINSDNTTLKSTIYCKGESKETFKTGDSDIYEMNIGRDSSSTGNVWISGINIQKGGTESTIIPASAPPSFFHTRDPWKLSEIPRIAHFYWGGKMPFLRYLSVYSFLKQNPDWKVKLHVPKVLGSISPTWRTGEQSQGKDIQSSGKDYINDLRAIGTVEFVEHDLETYGLKNSIHEVHKSDLIRWMLLSTEGGVWSDCDVLYHQPMFFMPGNTVENSDKDTGICKYGSEDSWGTGAHAIGFLMSSANNLYYRNLFNLSKRTFRSNRYQVIGAELINKRFKSLKKSSANCKFLAINPKSVYSLTNIPDFISNKIYLQDYPDAIGFHWYGGSPTVSSFEKNVNETNYRQFDHFLGKLVQLVME